MPYSRANFYVRTSDDRTNEPPGSISVQVLNGQGYAPSSDYASASVTITDNDRPVVTIRPGSPIREGGSARFTLTATPRPAAPIEVHLTVTENGRFASADELGARTVTIGTGGKATIQVATDRDDTDEEDGSITATLQSSNGYDVGSPLSASVDVSDGGIPTPRISIRARSSEIVEGGAATFDLTASPAPPGSLEVQVEVTDSGDFARPGADGTRTVTIGASGKASFDVETENDLVAESDGSVTAVVQTGAGYLVTSASRASVTVRDESVEIRIRSEGDIVEGESARFILTSHPAPPESVDVNVSVTQSGDFLPGGAYSDVVSVGTDGRATLVVDTLDDERTEKDGSITVSVESGATYVLGSPARATARVSDSTPTVTIAPGQTILEGDTAVFTLSATPAPSNNISVRVNVTESTPGRFALADETGVRNVTVATDGVGTLEVRTDDDDTSEGHGEIQARIVSDPNREFYRVGSPAATSLRVNDNDSAPGRLAVSVADAEVVEGARNGRYGMTELAFAVTLNKAAGRSVSVTFETRPPSGADSSSATRGSDYRHPDYLTLGVTLPPGETEQTLYVRVFDDDEYEPQPETFELFVSDIQGADIADGVAIGTILPDPHDAPRGTPVVTITGGAVVTEGQPAVFKLTAEPAPEEDLVVDVTVFDDSIGHPPSDYIAAGGEGSRQVTIPGADKQEYRAFGNSVATLTVRTMNDTEAEASGKVRVEIEHDVNGLYLTGDPFSAEVDVRDNDGEKPAVAPAFSISDARANESEGLMVFDVTLDPAVPMGAGPMTVFYQILSWGDYPGGAKRGVDFESDHGTLKFYGGDYVKSIPIRIIEDAHDEGEESFVIYLSRPGGGATIQDGVGRGVIVNSDPLPGAWLSRFGRAVAEQTIDSITTRLDGPRAAGAEGMVAGFALGTNARSSSLAAPGHGTAPYRAGERYGGLAAGTATDRFGGDPGASGAVAGRPATLGDLLGRSQFAVTSSADAAGGSRAFWGRGSQTHFGGEVEELGLEGRGTMAMLGTDYARGKWLVGLAVAQSRGTGNYGDAASPEDHLGIAGAVETSLTAAIPYASWRASDRLRLWGAAGYGLGEVTLGTHQSGSLRTDVNWAMAAAGLRSDLFTTGEGTALAVVSDALWAHTGSARTADLVATNGAVTRLRLGLEGSRRLSLPGGGSLRPKLLVGARHDDGDAETGLGMEVGAGVAWTDPRLGLRLDLERRVLIAHQDGAMMDRGFSASFTYDPRPSSARGLSLGLRQDIGARASGGLDSLFSGDAVIGHGHQFQDSGRWTAEAGYGLDAFGGRFIGTPHVGYGVSAGAREFGVGWRLGTEVREGARDLSLGILAVRRMSIHRPTDHRIGIQLRAR